MSNSTILGQSDMVLAITEDTINYQFSQLHNRNIIHSNWNIMIFENPKTGAVAKVLVNQSEKDFSAHIDAQDFDYAYNAQVGAPTITVLENERKVLTFLVPFTSGTMYYWLGHGRASTLKTTDMSGWVYGFNVQIGSIEKDAKDTEWVTPESQTSFQKNCTDTGLNQDLFSISSIFMDFENANYSNYDAKQSKVPTNIEQLAIFQNLLSNYFKTLVKTDNPYILGYGMKLKQIKDDALFCPTALRYSTSYDDNAALRSFNFLMMMDGNDFPSGQDVGILPKSLVTTEDATESGVLAINFASFNDKFLQPFIQVIESSITKEFDTKKYSLSGQKWTLSTNESNTKKVDDGQSDFFQKTKIISSTDLTSNMTLVDEGSASLLLKNTIDYALDIKVQPWSIFHAGYQTEAEFWYSTSGQIDVGPDKKHKGQQGAINISCSLSDHGKMQVSDAVTVPYLGVSKDPEMPNNMTTPDAMILQSFRNESFEGSAASSSSDNYNSISDSFDDVKKGLDAAINGINSGKVILPLGKIYAFKNIQLYTTTSQDDNPILFKVDYALEA